MESCFAAMHFLSYCLEAYYRMAFYARTFIWPFDMVFAESSLCLLALSIYLGFFIFEISVHVCKHGGVWMYHW